MKPFKSNKTRRLFLRGLAAGSAALTAAPAVLASAYQQKLLLGNQNYDDRPYTYTANDQINIGLIGCGIRGVLDMKFSLEVPGVKLVAVCDLYDGRLDRARELWGNDLFLTKDYRELLARRDIDAVFIATPDHWHKTMFVEALKAGKHVYGEKPMVQKWEEGQAIISTQKSSGKLCQIGSQGLSSLGNEKAKQLYEEGAIGEIVLFDFFSDRYTAEGAWQYPIPPDANPQTVDFDAFLGNAPKVPYDNTRFFRWRNYRDYGTGVAGDLFVHAFSSLNYILSSHGPNRAQATGGLRYWKDGRDVPDVSITLYDFPKTDTHAAFNAAFRINFIAGSGGQGGFRLIGTEGDMEVSQTGVVLNRTKLSLMPTPYALGAFTEATQKKILAEYAAKIENPRASTLATGNTVWEAPAGYRGGNYDHTANFFRAIRGERKIVEDPIFGLRAAGAALLANHSYYEEKPVRWDPEKMKIV
ncbi:Gfo/Idh/MocA family protein [Persicitalea jodogahamensis]|uniref:Gfo/Idh/MocA family protein n=1 Tax=Persicitalea jodogahamensis TaxID=402147 RepID=UPI001679EE94|nr:Gfo/Idh/MocA family oxidoreductase [Persicitalea jodogahamensis]